MYADDYEGWLHHSAGASPWTRTWSWRLDREGYLVHDEKIASCPSWKSETWSYSQIYGIRTGYDWDEGQYKTGDDNCRYVNFLAPARTRTGAATTASKSIIYMDSIRTSSFMQYMTAITTTHGGLMGHLHLRHHNAANVAFQDGHVINADKWRLNEATRSSGGTARMSIGYDPDSGRFYRVSTSSDGTTSSRTYY